MIKVIYIYIYIYLMYFILFYIFNVLGKHCLMFAFLAFQLGLFLEVVVTYPSTFCVTPNGSLF